MSTRSRGFGPIAPPIVTPPAEPLAAPARNQPGHGRVENPKPEQDRESISAAARDAARNLTPHLEDSVPPGFRIKGMSVLRDADGHVRLSWAKTTREADDPYETARMISEGLADGGGLKTLPPITPPDRECDDLLSVYPLGDPHIGLYCWAEECGESFDLQTAIDQYLAVASILFRRAPVGSDALLIDLGDFYHADDPQYRTSSGRHVVDVDTRYGKVIPAGFDIMATLVDAALQQHRRVHVWCLRGNHDDKTTLALRGYLQGRYANNPRVVLDATPGKFHYLEFGANLLGATHGDSLKGKRGRTLHEIMTTDQRAAWGRTRHAKWFVGHVHHESTSEVGDCRVETYRTLAPKDAWHAASGYRSGRDTRLEIFHREHGESERHILSIGEIQAAMAAAKART
ncbi:MAG: metallophosphoesterase [Deltaproteobacteria bacterium]|nr:metallophosphoesterase [Deltaproteobacteria bacterium]